jgi:hypothetical protein
VQREIERGLGVGIALDRAIHHLEDLLDVERIAALERGKEVVLQHGHGRSRRLSVVHPMVAAPLAHHRGLAQPLHAGVGLEPHEDVAAHRGRHRRHPVQPSPRHRHPDDLEVGDLHRPATSMSSSFVVTVVRFS